MVRAKNVLGMLMQNFFALGLISVLWAVIGYSLAFGGDGELHRQLRLRRSSRTSATPPSLARLRRRCRIPPLLFIGYQMMFAIITPALITGAIADRMQFRRGSGSSASGLCSSTRRSRTGCSRPRAGCSSVGALDFAGGAVVHINAGIAALAVVLVLGKRQGWPQGTRCRPTRCRSRSSAPGSCGSAGSGSTPARRSAPNGVAVQALINTHLAAAAGDARAGSWSRSSARARHHPRRGVRRGRRSRRHHAVRRLRRRDDAASSSARSPASSAISPSA